MLLVIVLKSGGQTFSALDVEQDLLEHPLISEAIVVGIDDEEYGECVAAAIVLKDVSP
jgi:malonyl-CoA/methylmalonyl-CoA synthetase